MLFKNTIQSLGSKEEIKLTVLPLWVIGQSQPAKLFRALQIFFQVLFAGSSYDVISLWASRKGMISLAPLLKLACSIHRKPLLLRFFGFNYDRPLAEYPLATRLLTRLTFRAGDLILLETKIAAELMQAEFPEANIKVHGNYRAIPQREIVPQDRCSRFVYLGKINPQKGVPAILEAAPALGSSDVSIDVYGPFEGGLTAGIFESSPNVHYRGIVDPAAIPEVLADYQVLLLPSTYQNEGHPGVILEAFASGLPVIASDLPGIREIVDSSCGILIPAGDSRELGIAMEKMVSEPAYYQRLAEQVLRRRGDYSLSGGVDQFLAHCRHLHAMKYAADQTGT